MTGECVVHKMCARDPSKMSLSACGTSAEKRVKKWMNEKKSTKMIKLRILNTSIIKVENLKFINKHAQRKYPTLSYFFFVVHSHTNFNSLFFPKLIPYFWWVCCVCACVCVSMGRESVLWFAFLFVKFFSW